MSGTLKIIIGIIIVAVIGLGVGLTIHHFATGKTTAANQSANQQSQDTNTSIDLPASSNSFAWGITVLTFPFPTYEPAFTGTQMTEAKKLGVGYIRVDYVPGNPKATDLAVSDAGKQGLKVVLIIPYGPKDIFSDTNLTQNTTNYVKDLVNHYKGKVAIYQLGTEAASVALNNNAALSGIDLKDYPTAKLNAVTTWVAQAAKTVKQTDPSAKTLVNDQWVHVGFFDNYFAKGGDFDILGWNWFSDMGTSMDRVTIDASKNQYYDLMSKLTSYHKPIWLTEVNRRLGSQGGHEQDAANFINTMASYALKQPTIKGFFVFNLLGDQAAPPQEQGYGIINAADNGKSQTITGEKVPFTTYQSIITNNK